MRDVVKTKLENTNEVMYAHDPDDCAGEVCPLHRRTDHAMRRWPQHWRPDRGLMERICPHGVGHPDPDHLAAMRVIDSKKAETDSVHGCDGCCGTEPEIRSAPATLTTSFVRPPDAEADTRPAIADVPKAAQEFDEGWPTFRLDRLQSSRTRMERDVLEIIANFESVTGLEVREVRLERADMAVASKDGRPTRLILVETRVELP